MKISRTWLQRSFDVPLPDTAALAQALTFHAFEIDGVENEVLDVKVTANRGHDCLCHFGIAAELSAILDVPLKEVRHTLAVEDIKTTIDTPVVSIDTPHCARYIAGVVRGVKVGPSPRWLREALESIGQRSINNVVDAANFVMFDIGQPLHAFDANKLADGRKIGVRAARTGEALCGLDDKKYRLGPADLVIVDGSDAPVGIAGVKGGKATGVDESTTDLILESANFDGVSVRKTSQSLKLRTDASQRFEQGIAPELAARGMRALMELIREIAGGEVVGSVDAYPQLRERAAVCVSRAKINAVLGTALAADAVADVFRRLRFSVERKPDDVFCVMPPFERLDIAVAEDLVEEAARILGYDAVPETPLPDIAITPEINTTFYAAERARERLMSEGASEVFTSVFADEGERVVLNKVDGVRPFLRKSLVPGLTDALDRNRRNKDLLDTPDVRLFEIGAVWKGGKEIVMVGVADQNGVSEEPLVIEESAPAAYETLPLSRSVRYRSFSKYPFVARDIAMWVPTGTNADDVLGVVRASAGGLLIRSGLFDEFKKGERVSYAFRLVFQSPERTLTDAEINVQMEHVTAAVKKHGWEVR